MRRMRRRRRRRRRRSTVLKELATFIFMVTPGRYIKHQPS